MDIQIIDNCVNVDLYDNVIDVIDFGNVTINTTGLSPENVYTKIQVDNLLANKQDINSYINGGEF
jgi:hypothetical protein